MELFYVLVLFCGIAAIHGTSECSQEQGCDSDGIVCDERGGISSHASGSCFASSSKMRGQTECKPKNFGHDSVVCVCDADYCDRLDRVPFPSAGHYTVVTSSRDGLRFSVQNGDVEGKANPNAKVIVRVNGNLTYQTMLGFGGAFTDSTGINVKKLSLDAQANLMRSYFGPEGIEYGICRIPIGGTDFSLRPYSYDDVEGDLELKNFALAEEDLKYKIPLILKAMEISPKSLKFFGSPWSPPAWMKTNGKVNGAGSLKRELWDCWAKYLTLFVKAYEEAGIPLWGLTTQNEPLAGFREDWPINNCGWTAEDMRDWIKSTLGPTLEHQGMRRLKLMVHDTNRDVIEWYPSRTLEDPDSSRYIDGTAVHWYFDKTSDPRLLDELHGKFNDKFILYTEACAGFDVSGPESVALGSWERAESYAHSILESTQHFSTGWVDWNMALDMNGGPLWIDNNVDSPIIVNAETDEFYKQPLFYALGHFSKFVVEGALRVYSSVVGSDALEAVAFKDPSGAWITVLLNTGEEALEVSLTDLSGRYLNFNVPAKAIQTVLYPEATAL